MHPIVEPTAHQSGYYCSHPPAQFSDGCPVVALLASIKLPVPLALAASRFSSQKHRGIVYLGDEVCFARELRIEKRKDL